MRPCAHFRPSILASLERHIAHFGQLLSRAQYYTSMIRFSAAAILPFRLSTFASCRRHFYFHAGLSPLTPLHGVGRSSRSDAADGASASYANITTTTLEFFTSSRLGISRRRPRYAVSAQYFGMDAPAGEIYRKGISCQWPLSPLISLSFLPRGTAFDRPSYRRRTSKMLPAALDDMRGAERDFLRPLPPQGDAGFSAAHDGWARRAQPAAAGRPPADEEPRSSRHRRQSGGGAISMDRSRRNAFVSVARAGKVFSDGRTSAAPPRCSARQGR